MITSSYPRHAGDGVGSFVGSLARALVTLGHDVHVVAPHDPAVGPMDHGGVQVHRFRYAPREHLHLVGHGRALEADRRLKPVVPFLMPGFVAAASALALRLHRQKRFDLLHAHWALPSGAIAGIVARLTCLPLVISLHGSDVYVMERNRLYAAVARSGFRRASAVTACSEDLRRRAAAMGLEATRVSVIPYGVDAARYASGHGSRLRRRLGVPDSARVIGALGRLVHKKGFSSLLSAMPRVLGDVPDAYCVIGGEGDMREALTTQAERLGVGQRVLFPGHIHWQDTPDYYAMCDVVAVPSIVDVQGNVDGLPNVLLEAMASGRAVVASRVGGIPSVIEDDVNGMLVPAGDEESLASRLRMTLRDPELRGRLGARAHESMARSHDWSAVAERVASIYACAVERSRWGK